MTDLIINRPATTPSFEFKKRFKKNKETHYIQLSIGDSLKASPIESCMKSKADHL